MTTPDPARYRDFSAILLRTHQPTPPSPDSPFILCTCGRPTVTCEIAAAARDAGLHQPLNAPDAAHAHRPHTTMFPIPTVTTATREQE